VLTDHGVVALRQRLDELVGAGKLGARRTMASGASGSANAMLPRTVSAKRNVSSKTMPTAPPELADA